MIHPNNKNSAFSMIFTLCILVAASILHTYYYYSALYTHTLDYFFAQGNVHEHQGIDFYQIPKAYFSYTHGGELTGDNSNPEPPYPLSNRNVYHPFTTIIIGKVFSAFEAVTAFKLFALIKFILTLALAIGLTIKFRNNQKLVLALLIYFLYFPQYLEIWNGQYHFLLTFSMFFIIIFRKNTLHSKIIQGFFLLLSLLIKPIAVLFVPVFLFQKRILPLILAIGSFSLITLYYIYNGTGWYYINNLIDRITSPIGGPPGVYTLDAIYRYFSLDPLVLKLIKLLFLIIPVLLIWFKKIRFINGLLLYTIYYLLFYDFVFEYHYTILIPFFVFEILEHQKLRLKYLLLIIVSALPTPFFLMRYAQYMVNGNIVTNEGWIISVLIRTVPLVLYYLFIMYDSIAAPKTNSTS